MVNQVRPGALLQYADVLQEDVLKAQDELVSYVQTKNFEDEHGVIDEFKDTIRTIYADFGNDPKRAFPSLGYIFNLVVSHAVDNELMDPKVGDIFYDENVDQVAFVHEVCQKILQLN